MVVEDEPDQQIATGLLEGARHAVDIVIIDHEPFFFINDFLVHSDFQVID